MTFLKFLFRSAIKDNGKAVDRVSTMNILDCDSFISLWVIWANNSIQLRSGTFADNVILQYNDIEDMRPVNVITISSTNGRDSEWEIPQGQSE